MRLLLSCFLFCAFSFAALAQEEGRIHVVKKGETLYGISKQYNFTIDDLIFFNPNLELEELKKGMKLVIPSDEKIIELKERRQKARMDSLKYIYHKVVKGETEFSLTQHYAISIKDLREANPDIEAKSLRVDLMVKIPRKLSEAGLNTIAIDQKSDSADYKMEGAWLFYKVQKKETAYSLSKRFEISTDSLYLLNEEAANGLRIGQWLKLPKNRIKYLKIKPSGVHSLKEGDMQETVIQGAMQEGNLPTVSGAVEGDFFLYKVKAGDTFFSLNQRYNVSQDELLAVNPELKKGLRVGKYIIIAKKKASKEISWLERILKEEQEKEKAEQQVDSITKKTKRILNQPEETPVVIKTPRRGRDTNEVDIFQTYRVAIVLPFKAKSYRDTLNERSFKPHRDTEMASQFYFGFLMAADSIKNMGMNLEIELYDSEGSKNTIAAIARSIDSNQVHMVIGPAYKNNVQLMAKALEESDIPVISPLSVGVDVSNQSNLIQMIPPSESKFKYIADLINTKFKEANVIFAHCGSVAEEREVQAIKARLNPRDAQFITSIVSCADLQSRWALRDRLSTLNGQKLIVMLGDDPVFLSDIIAKLYVIRDTSIKVVGSPRLLNYPTMELSYLNSLNYHTYEFRNVDYSNPETNQFVKEFRARFNADPGPFALQGFDAGLYFLPKLWRYGFLFPTHLRAEQKNVMGFDWQRKGNGGWENKHLFLTRLQGFKSRRVYLEEEKEEINE